MGSRWVEEFKADVLYLNVSINFVHFIFPHSCISVALWPVLEPAVEML